MIKDMPALLLAVFHSNIKDSVIQGIIFIHYQNQSSVATHFVITVM